jgi:Family of unknown function (DUF5367)
MHPRLILSGFAVWVLATLGLRLAGEHVLHSGDWKALAVLFGVSFPLMAWVTRRVCRRLPREQWLAGALSFALPTLLLDPFSSAFFPVVFPNIAPAMAGVFGGWMLWCCAGAFAGVAVRRPA